MIDPMELGPTICHVTEHLKFKMADIKPEVDYMSLGILDRSEIPSENYRFSRIMNPKEL